MYASATAMILETSGIALVGQAIRVPLAIDPLVVVPDDRRDLRVVVNMGKDALPDRGVLLHLPTLIKSQRPGLFEETGRKPDLPDVVNKSAKVGLFAILRGKAHAFRDVTRIDRHRSRVTSRVAIPCIERCDQRSGELEVGPLERLVDSGELTRELSLLLIQAVEPLSGHSRHKEERECPGETSV